MSSLKQHTLTKWNSGGGYTNTAPRLRDPRRAELAKQLEQFAVRDGHGEIDVSATLFKLQRRAVLQGLTDDQLHKLATGTAQVAADTRVLNGGDDLHKRKG